MNKMLLIMLFISFGGFSQSKNPFQMKLYQSDAIENNWKRLLNLRKLIDNEILVSTEIKYTDTLKLRYMVSINKSGKLSLVSNKIKEEKLHKFLTSIFKDTLYVEPFYDYNKNLNEVQFYRYNKYLLGINNEYKKLIPVGKAPVFPNCFGNNGQLSNCMNRNLKKHIANNFNVDLANSLGLSSGKKRISIQFLIDKNGDIVDVRVRAPHNKLKEEAIRVIKLLPKMIPGKQDGEPVKVRYNLPIVFNVEDYIPLSKAQIKAAKRNRKKAAQAARLKKFSE